MPDFFTPHREPRFGRSAVDALGQQLSTGIPRRANGSYALIFPQAQFRA